MTRLHREVIGGCTLYRGDCMDVLPTLGRFDAVVTDPPYGINENTKRVADRQRRQGGKSTALADQRDYGAFEWDESPPAAECFDLIARISTHQIIFGGNFFPLGPTSCWLVWDKEVNGDFADCELAWTNLKKAVRRIRWQWNGMIRKGHEERFHPTQKPLGVMSWCLTHIPDARLIADPFMGSGTTGVACVKAGVSFIGIEREQTYFDVACRRIEAAYRQIDMFAPAQSAPDREVWKQPSLSLGGQE